MNFNKFSISIDFSQYKDLISHSIKYFFFHDDLSQYDSSEQAVYYRLNFDDIVFYCDEPIFVFSDIDSDFHFFDARLHFDCIELFELDTRFDPDNVLYDIDFECFIKGVIFDKSYPYLYF